MKPSIEETTAPSRGFPPSMRVLHSSEFQAVYASGTRYYTKYFVVVVAPSASGNAGREGPTQYSNRSPLARVPIAPQTPYGVRPPREAC